MTTIGLAMIVKNEEDVIGRCIDSVQGLIDYWVICDTGSTDATRAVAEAALDGIPGEWHERPWVDMGHNRSALMALARGCADYLLLLDADETVTWTPGLKERLHADAYRIVHKATHEQWHNKKLVRGDLPWRYIGTMHEYITVDRPTSAEFLPELVIDVHPEKLRVQKLHRNVELLETQLERTPDGARWHFYQAQTYRDLFNMTQPRNLAYAERAIEHYRRRIELGEGGEAFLSRWNIGVLLADALDDWPAAMDALIDAWERQPDRIEPLYELVSRLRQRGHAYTAYALLQPALSAELPAFSGAFVQRWMYEWGVQFEHALLAYAVGKNDEALVATESLLANPNLPDRHRPGFEQLKAELIEQIAQEHEQAASAE